MRPVRIWFLVCVIAALTASAAPGQQAEGAMRLSVVVDSAEWRMLKSLVGTWEGTMSEGSQSMPATLDVRLTGDGSTVMHILGGGTPYEMVTMFHTDGTRLLATHYCSAHNQPRLVRVQAKAPNQVAFDYLDGTNIAPGDHHITGVVLTFVDADHHDEAWSGSGGGAPAQFKFARKK